MKKEWLILLVITFIVVTAWVGASIVNTKPAEAPDPGLEKALQPLNPNFDQTTLNKIDQTVGTQ